MKKIKEGAIFFTVVVVLIGVFFVAMNIISPQTHQEVDRNKTTQKSKTTIKKIKLVALGDSLTHGVGDTTNRGGYVYLIKQKIQRNYAATVSTYNYGKTGDRSDQIQKRLEASNSMQKNVKTANVITLTVGGNDMMQVLQNNFLLLASNKLSTVMPTAKEKYQQRLTALIKTIRTYNKNSPIFLYSIYNPFYVYFPTLTDLQKYTAQWNEIAKKIAKKNMNIYFVDVNAQLSEGQYLGKSKTQLKTSSKLNLNTTSSTKLEDILSNQKEKNNFLSNTDHFHPNLRGYKYMTQRLFDVMKKHKKTWLKGSD
ncbi:SGNH/GDSL hydrolase family protein [Ligilactobacillus sp. WILCCON 0076]|uniref:SGNH/GDSL hydrolase family protein n=1 Tax=Ligilactobacillus ubinensis TaxID=2876789 RepID=A0A9X2FHJ1_9LACO|nr:SGNH/GDSL hydrolase family protein [Ligilactobacillus ubinensis]MCP0886151.1 SGNH/GDSL hydrolase family protein [Ligilactobacillus ubinensis]